MTVQSMHFFCPELQFSIELQLLHFEEISGVGFESPLVSKDIVSGHT